MYAKGDWLRRIVSACPVKTGCGDGACPLLRRKMKKVKCKMQNAKCGPGVAPWNGSTADSYFPFFNFHFSIFNLHFAFLLLAPTTCASTARAAPPWAIPVEGRPFRAELTAVDAAWHLTFDVDKRPRTLPAADLVVWGQCAEQGRGGALILADGGILAVESVSADKEKLTAASEIFGTQKLPIEALCGVVFHPPFDRQKRDALFDRIARATGESDRLLLDNGDELTGLLVGIASDKANLDADVGRVEIATERIVAIIFNPALTRRPSPAGNSLRGSDKTGTGSEPREYSGTKAAHREVPVPVLSEGVRAWAGFRDGSRLLATEMLCRRHRCGSRPTVKHGTPRRIDWSSCNRLAAGWSTSPTSSRPSIIRFRTSIFPGPIGPTAM